MNDYYDIDGNELDPNDHVTAWSDRARRIGSDDLGEVHISTVHLVLNHQWTQEAAPLIFETMIFGGEHDEWQCRWATKENAAAGHKETVAWLLNEGPEPQGDYAMSRAEWDAARV